MIKVTYEGKEAVMSYEELLTLLNNCELPWYTDGNFICPQISVVGSQVDLVLQGEMV